MTLENENRILRYALKKMLDEARNDLRNNPRNPYYKVVQLAQEAYSYRTPAHNANILQRLTDRCELVLRGVAEQTELIGLVAEAREALSTQPPEAP